MDLPNSVDILGHPYEIVMKEDLLDCMGMCNTDQCIIYISTTSSDSQKLDTLFHEILEAFNYQLEMKLKHRNIQALGNCFYLLLKSNPDLVSMFIQKNKDEDEESKLKVGFKVDKDKI